ncbi:MAG: hypothetical protein ACLP4R_17430 [Solirubrobacteraceae bacterium]
MQPTYARQTRLGPAPTASSALLVEGEYVCRAAARSHQMMSRPSRTVRAPRRPGKPGTVANDRDQSNGVESTLADDLVRLASELTTVVLLAGGEQPASAVWGAREQGTEIVLAIPASCGALVAEPLREAVTRVIGLHPEVFEALFEIREAGWQRPEARGTARPSSVGAPR